MAQETKLTPFGSVVLDIMRFAAACAVCYGHFSLPLFSTGWKTRMDIAGYAVAVFFVLSGFMMRLITTTRTITPRDYWVDRASRMYSVVLPAVLLTVIVNSIGLLYVKGHLPQGIFATPPKLLLSTATDSLFVSQWLGMDITNPCNPVFWSLSYECSYYLLFGLILFVRGRKMWLGLAGVCLLLGLPILLLFPVWLFGCLAHDAYQRLRTYRSSWLIMTAGLAAGCATAAEFLRAVRSISDTRGVVFAAVWMRTIDRYLHERNLHIFQRASLDFYAIGIPTAILIVWLLLIGDRLYRLMPVNRVRWIRVIAEGTFALYLMHHALFVLFADLTVYPKGSLVMKGSILLMTICLCIAISFPLERFKRWLRHVMHGRQHSLFEEIKQSRSPSATPL